MQVRAPRWLARILIAGGARPAREPISNESVERLAWYLFIEHDDMGHEPTAVQARLVWENPRHGARQAARERARRYLEAAAGRLHAGRID